MIIKFYVSIIAIKLLISSKSKVVFVEMPHRVVKRDHAQQMVCKDRKLYFEENCAVRSAVQLICMTSTCIILIIPVISV